MIRPKIGIITCGWPIVEQLHKKYAEYLKLSDRAAAELMEIGLDVFKFEHPVNTLSDAEKFVNVLRNKDVDLLIIYYPVPSEDQPTYIVQKLLNIPVLLWTPYPATVLGFMSLWATSSSLTRLGKRTFRIIGSLSDTYVKRELLQITKAAAVSKRIRTSKVAMVGAIQPGMKDMSFRESDVQSLIGNLAHIELEELLLRLQKINESQVKEVVKQVRDKIDNVAVKKNDLFSAARMYLAIKSLIKDYGLEALTIREWPELASMKLSVYLANSLLNDEGIPCVPECDVSGLITAFILSNLVGGATWLCEFNGPPESDEKVVFIHGGDAALSLGNSRKKASLAPLQLVRGFSGSEGGVGIQLVYKSGRVTLASLNIDTAEGRPKMLIFTGEAISGPEQQGASVAHVKFDHRVEKVMDDVFEGGFSHHFVMCPGDVSEALEKVCTMLNINVVRVKV